jgi:hypothetical protein
MSGPCDLEEVHGLLGRPLAGGIGGSVDVNRDGDGLQDILEHQVTCSQ